MISGAVLDLCPAYGWQVEPSFETLIKQLQSGYERRRSKRTKVQHRYTLPFQNIPDEAFRRLKALFLVARGSAESFLVDDPSDNSASVEPFGVGDGAETDFDLIIQSSFGSGSYTREILYPVNPIFYVDGLPATATFNGTSKKVEFSVAPDVGSVLTWSGQFLVPVRFASDTFPMSIDNRFGDGQYAMNGSVDLLEVFE